LWLAAACLLVPLGKAGGELVTFSDESAFTAAIGSYTLVDFDDIDRSFLDQQYSGLGLDFNPFAGGEPRVVGPVVGKYITWYPKSGDNQLSTVPDRDGGGGFELVFSEPINAVGIFLGNYEGPDYGSTFFEFFGPSNQSLGDLDLQYHIDPGPLTWTFFGVTSTDPISKLQVEIGSLDFVVFDDLRFQSIPEPSALITLTGLLGMGLLAGWWRRRKAA